MENQLKTDGMYIISLLEGQARAILVDSTQLCEAARKTHGLSRVATAALGRLLSMTAIMGAQLKGAGDLVTCRVQGDGPIGMLLAVGKPDGTVKGYVDNPLLEIPHEGDKLPVGEAVGRRGMLTVIRDLGLKEPYVGQVHLVSGELAEDFAMYYTASEQTPSLVSLGVLTKDAVLAAGGLLVQMMPGASEIAIRSVEESAPMFMNLSKTMLEYGLQGSVNQLLLHLQPEILEKRDVRYHCDCTRDRVSRALISLGREELQSMIDEDHGASIDCHFCKTRYKFTEEALRALLLNAGRP